MPPGQTVLPVQVPSSPSRTQVIRELLDDLDYSSACYKKVCESEEKRTIVSISSCCC